MLNLKTEKTYKIINFILKRIEFTQKDIHEQTRVSKGLVSRVVNWLLEQGYVKKTDSKYRLVNASVVFSLFSLFRQMQKNLVQNFSIKASREKAFKELAKRKVVFCSSTALQEYSGYYNDPSINCYSDDRKILQGLSAEAPGLTKINVFKPDLFLNLDIEKKHGILLTSPVRTIIDLFCDNKAYAAKELIEKKYGEKIG